MEVNKAFVAAVFYGGPHDQVVGPSLAVALIRCTEFVEGVFSHMEEDCSGNNLILILGQDCKTMVSGNNLSLHLLEKEEWLRGGSVTLSSHAVKIVIGFHVFRIFSNGHPDPCLLCLDHVSASTCSKLPEKIFGVR